MAREYTTRLLELAEEGVLTWQGLAEAALRYMSEAEVRDLAESDFGEIVDDSEGEEEEEEEDE